MNSSILVLMALLAITSAGKRKSGETIYKINFQKTVSDCDDFSNDMLDASNLVLEINDAGDGYLTGGINIMKEIPEGAEVVITAMKETDVGREFFYEIEGDLCEHLSDEDAPWTPLFQALGVSGCPMEAKDYPIEKLQLNLDYAKEFMTNAFVSDYFATIALQVKDEDDTLPTKIMCYGMSLSVIEVKDDGDDE